MARLEFKNKTVLITGGGSGIGEAMAYQYARKGCNVILSGRRPEALERVRKACEELGVKAWTKTVDVEKSESNDELVAWIHAEGHLIDFLLLCIVILCVTLWSYLFVSFIVLVEFNIASSCVNCAYCSLRYR